LLANSILLSSIKKLAGQTLWYGLSNVAGRFLNYLLTFLHVSLFQSAEYGDVSIFYANAALLNIFFTYGMETAYFRFVQQSDPNKVYSTGFISLLGSTIFLSGLMIFFRQPIADFMKTGSHPEWITWLALIIAADTMTALPFALLRQQNRPKKYAFIKLANIFLTIGLQLFFFWVYPKMFNKQVDIGYVFLSNLIASAATLLLLSKELSLIKWKFDTGLWKQIIPYALPLIVVGFGGMINETIDRQLLLRMYDGTVEQAKSATGIYSANYKLAILIVLFIQAFRMGAEPFFFQQAGQENAQRTYARVMKFFVIACCFCFLFIVMFLDDWKHLISFKYAEYAKGIAVVPLLALAKIFLGVYYNLSIWYKLKDKNMIGAWITVGGALITIAFNWIFIPIWGYMACAIATVLCYGFMMVASYRLGQKHYPIPYAWKKLVAYIVICVLLFLLHRLFVSFGLNVWLNRGMAIGLIGLFVLLILKVERKELAKLPLIGKYI
jgi:O-antigen/teichoic acid export membrane protein